jgi:hypothetical protein
LTETLAQQVEQVANYLRNKDARAMRTDLENLARRQPALMLGGALLLGLMGARFIKSSQRDQRNRGSGFRGYGRENQFGYTGYNQPFTSQGTETQRHMPADVSGGYSGGGYAGA